MVARRGGPSHGRKGSGAGGASGAGAEELEDELHRALEDAGVIGAGDRGKGAGARIDRGVAGILEVWVVQSIECLNPEIQLRSFRDREEPADFCIQVDVLRPTEGVSSQIAVGAVWLVSKGALVEVDLLIRGDLVVRIGS